MKDPKFKVGDWCYCEFDLQQIVRTEDDRICEVSDGFFHLSGRDLSDECYPLDMDIKRISDEVQSWSKEFHSLKNCALNHPDLKRKLIEYWVQLCDNRNNPENLKMLYSRLTNFGNSIITKVRDLSFEEVDGVKLFRQ